MRASDFLVEINQATAVEIKPTFEKDMAAVIKKHPDLASAIDQELKAFFALKKEKDLLTPYNGRDKKFNTGTPLSNFLHVHLTSLKVKPPIVLIYTIEGTKLVFHGLVSHSAYDTAKGAKKLSKKYS